MGPAPDVLPPLRDVNHSIPYIDEKKRFEYHAPRCPEAFVDELKEKLARYERAHIWERATGTQAMPMLCIAKASGKLRTVVDARKRNANTFLDATPLPDQDWIRNAVARAKYCTKIDMMDAYEQTRVIPEDVWKTLFATPFGTYVSNTLQQGDCNGPSTCQRSMVWIFRDKLGITIFIYIDDIFICTFTVKDMEEALEYVFQTLKKEKLYISPKKFFPYLKEVDCLGVMVDAEGIHADQDKMSRVREWPTPRSYPEVQRFLGMIEYIARFLPNVAAFTTPLSGMCANGHPFIWRAHHEKCFQEIKRIACHTPVLRPIDSKNPEQIWVVCDACPAGVGAYYGQGKTWKDCQPAGFMSKKFTNAQRSYFTYEHETLAVLEALLKWEDKLVGREFTIITDHEALKFFREKDHHAARPIRWSQHLERFRYNVVYVKGQSNKVSDALSRWFENRTDDDCGEDDFVQADIRLDPEGDDLPKARILECKAIRVAAIQRLKEREHQRDKEAHELATAQQGLNPTVGESEGIDELVMEPLADSEEFFNAVKMAYEGDSLFRKINSKLEQFPNFRREEGLLVTTNEKGYRVVCIPRRPFKGRRMNEIILDHGHRVVGHMGARITRDFLRRYYWWPSMTEEINKFCDSCGQCQRAKTVNQRPAGLLHSLPIPRKPWSSIAMDFAGPFPQAGEFDYLWVILCRLSSMVHLIPVTTTLTATKAADRFVTEIVRLHGLPDSIVSDRDTKFTSKFWTEVHRLLGTRLKMSTAFHPQTDGASERMIRKVSQILRTVVKPDQTDWVGKLPMVEFACNASKNSSTGLAPFEIVYGHMPRMVQEVPATAYPGVREFADQVMNNLAQAHDALIESRVNQAYHANSKRREGDIFEVDDLVYLSTENLNLPKGRARKLLPKYIGPYKVLWADATTSTYKLELPAELVARRIHPRFHVSKLRAHHPNDDVSFPGREVNVYYDFGQPTDQEWQVTELIGHRWEGNKVSFLIQWETGECTWEPYAHCKDLEALDMYLDLQGVQSWRSLPKKGKGAK
jgi:hypothetical protein